MSRAPPPVFEPEPEGPGEALVSVPSFAVEDGATCRYLTVVRSPLPGETGGEYHVEVRWSEMEQLVKDLRLGLGMPESIQLPKYYFKTVDDAKLEMRRQELEAFWEGFLHWYGTDGGRATEIVQSRPLQMLFQHETTKYVDSGAVPLPAVSAPTRGDTDDSPYFGSGRRKADPDSFELLCTLGKGSFGKVLMVRKKDTGGIYAMKILQKRKVVARNQVDHTRSERSVLERMRHIPFIVHVHWAFQTPDNLFLVLDYVPGGELFFHLKEHGRFAENAVQFYAAQMVLALEQIHRMGVIYRDLKPENLLVDEHGYIKLTDFGLSKEGVEEDSEGADTFCGTAEYLAPELLQVSPPSTAHRAMI